MADVLYEVNSGFYDSVNQDRLYGAEDMNKPYHRIVSNGVFATASGTPSNDFRVVAGSGLAVTVKAGAGIFGDKWFESLADLSIALENNNGILPRIDSIIAQVDTNTDTRAGSIVYRTGTPSSTPTAPALSTDTGVYEYRIANITVPAGASSITDSAISDQRGSAECPWVSSLITQVDTSVLFNQWQTAYQQYYSQTTASMNAYIAQQQQAWEDFFAQAQDDLTATNSIVRLMAKTNTGSIGQVGSDWYLAAPVTYYIPTFDSSTDMLNVYINGILLDTTMWEYQTSGSFSGYIKFNFAPPDISNKLLIECLKSVTPSGLASVQSIIQDMSDQLAAATFDTGWVALTWQNGASAYDENNATAIRKIGERVFLRGAVKGASSANTIYTMVSAGYYPTQKQYLTAPILSGATVKGTCVFEIDTSGNVKLLSTSAAIGSSDMVPLDFCYSV